MRLEAPNKANQNVIKFKGNYINLSFHLVFKINFIKLVFIGQMILSKMISAQIIWTLFWKFFLLKMSDIELCTTTNKLKSSSLPSHVYSIQGRIKSNEIKKYISKPIN